jgi:DNA invertase Pin-like site-specific DNA recombinase
MSDKVVGYIRVSTYDQNPERQLDGMHLDNLSSGLESR